MKSRSFLMSTVLILGSLTVAEPDAFGQSRDRYAEPRAKLVRDYLEAEGIKNRRVLDAVRTVPRHEFVRPADRARAYFDMALPIGYRQTISPPYIVAYMTQVIDPKPTDKVLEIGTGSGYQAAVLGEMAGEVYSIEIVDRLGKAAGARLRRLGYDNVTTKVGDGYQGWKEHAPFDKIIVTCSPEKIPTPLAEQLKEGGRMIIPLGERYAQTFYLLEKQNGKLLQKKLIPTLFVPMTGISEDRREVLPDPENPVIRNGNFELDENEDGRTDNWHYQRLVTRETDDVKSGQVALKFESDTPGAMCQLLQGNAIDGKAVKLVNLSVWAKADGVLRGPQRGQLPGVRVYFYDRIRREIGAASMRPMLGSSDWEQHFARIPVPANAKEMIVRVGLNGGTGTLLVDDLRLLPERR